MVKPAKGSTLLQVGTSVRLSDWVFSVLQKTLRIICLNKVFKLWKVKKKFPRARLYVFFLVKLLYGIVVELPQSERPQAQVEVTRRLCFSGGKGSLNCEDSKNIYLVLVCGNLHRRSRFSRLKKRLPFEQPEKDEPDGQYLQVFVKLRRYLNLKWC